MDDNLKKLLLKLKEGNISDQEKILLEDWYLSEAAKKSFPKVSKIEIEEDLAVLKDFSPTEGSNKSRSNFFYWSAAAAILLLSLGALFYFKDSGIVLQGEEIAIGGNKAKLILSSGKMIDLANLQVNDSLVLNGMVIHKDEEGSISYMSAMKESTKPTYDEISTPRGGEFKIVLVDGTQVWLNANSSLKFFNNKQGVKREVWLDGEAYFEVAHDPQKPFLVNTVQQNVQVLGTKFNVKATNNYSQTTLIDGRVALRNGTVHLGPGEQLTTNLGIDQPVAKVDVESFLAWKEGYFLFNNERLEDVMEKISDWYAIDIEFKDQVKNEKIWATVSKYRDLKEVLKMIELTEAAHFSIEGRRVIVRKH